MSERAPAPVVPARLHESGFAKADSNFHSLTLAGDGRVYYTLSSHDIDTHGRCYRYDPAGDRLAELFDLGEATGEAGRRTLPQGKSHTPFFELDGRLYFATQYGYFAVSDSGKEHVADVPEGYKPYPGGHILAVDMKTGAPEDLARARAGEGILALAMDGARGRLYGLTWPSGIFLVYDIETGRLRELGGISRGGESGEGEEYFCLCRTFAVYPRNGNAYITNPDGEILCYSPGKDRVERVEGTSLRRDILGHYTGHEHGLQCYNWRKIVWHEESELFYGVHPRSGYLFVFDPATHRLDLVERIVSDELRASGAFEPFNYGYLSLDFGPDRETLYYLTSAGRAAVEGGRVVEGTTHLVTYNIRTHARADHGALRLEDGRYPTMSQTLAVHPNGTLYACPWIEKPDRAESDPVGHQCDLVSFADPRAKRSPGRASGARS